MALFAQAGVESGIATAVLIENRSPYGRHIEYLPLLYQHMRQRNPTERIAVGFFATSPAPPVWPAQGSRLLPDVVVDPSAPPVSVGSLLYATLTLAESDCKARHLFVVAHTPPTDDADVHPAANRAIVPKLQKLGTLPPPQRWAYLCEKLIQAHTRLHLLIRPEAMAPAIIDLFHGVREAHNDVEVPVWFVVDHANCSLYLSGPPATPGNLPSPPNMLQSPTQDQHSSAAIHSAALNPPSLIPHPPQGISLATQASLPPQNHSPPLQLQGPPLAMGLPTQVPYVVPSMHSSISGHSPPRSQRASPPGTGTPSLVSYLQSRHGLSRKRGPAGSGVPLVAENAAAVTGNAAMSMGAGARAKAVAKAAPVIGGVSKKPRIVSGSFGRSASLGMGMKEEDMLASPLVESPIAAKTEDPGNNLFIFPPEDQMRATHAQVPSFAPPGSGYPPLAQHQQTSVSPTTAQFPSPEQRMKTTTDRNYAMAPPPVPQRKTSPPQAQAQHPQMQPQASPEMHFAPPPHPPPGPARRSPPSENYPPMDQVLQQQQQQYAASSPEEFAPTNEETVPASSSQPAPADTPLMGPGQGFASPQDFMSAQAFANVGGFGLAGFASASPTYDTFGAQANGFAAPQAPPPTQPNAAMGGFVAPPPPHPTTMQSTDGYAGQHPPAQQTGRCGYATPPKGYRTPPNGFAIPPGGFASAQGYAPASQSMNGHPPLPATNGHTQPPPAPMNNRNLEYASDMSLSYPPSSGDGGGYTITTNGGSAFTVNTTPYSVKSTYASPPYAQNMAGGFAGMRTHAYAQPTYVEDVQGYWYPPLPVPIPPPTWSAGAAAGY